MRAIALLVLCAPCFFGAACSSRSSNGPAPVPSTQPTVGPPTPSVRVPELGPVLAPPTYYQDVAPILAGRCVQCHYDGSLAPQDLTDPDVARYFAGEIAEEVVARTMPAWLPGPKSPPLLHDPSLTDEQIDVFARWAAFRAPLGDPDHPAPLLTREVVEIGPTELAFDLGVDYQPAPTVDDDYRCFLADTGVTEDRVATGFRIVPGNEQIVHHVITTIFDAASRDALVSLDARTPETAGWPCFAGPVPEDLTGVARVSVLGEWDPGVDAVKLPPGTGSPIPAGAVAVIQMHYRVAGGDPDRTRVEVALAPKGTSLQVLRGVRIVDRVLSIPAETADVVAERAATVDALAGSSFFADGNGYVTMVAAQMQLLGVHATLEVETASGARTLLDLPAWDMHWQGTYQLVTPIPISATDTVRIRCVYDNTAAHRAQVKYSFPTTSVTAGDTLADEACIGELAVTDSLPK